MSLTAARRALGIYVHRHAQRRGRPSQQLLDQPIQALRVEVLAGHI
jgi:hypothetical protein